MSRFDHCLGSAPFAVWHDLGIQPERKPVVPAEVDPYLQAKRSSLPKWIETTKGTCEKDRTHDSYSYWLVANDAKAHAGTKTGKFKVGDKVRHKTCNDYCGGPGVITALSVHGYADIDYPKHRATDPFDKIEVVTIRPRNQ